MPSTGLKRWLVFVLCSALATLGRSVDPEQGDAAGSLSLDLVLADDIEINSVSWTISGNDMEPMSGAIDTSAPGATASVEVFGLPPGDGYLVELEATSENGEVTCEGSAEFGVEIGAATGVMVRLHCKVPDGTGAVRVNGKFNLCAKLIKAVVAPLQTSVGNDIDLFAGATDPDGNRVEYLWTGTGGSIAEPSASSTTYTCEETGTQMITVTVSDDGFQHCMHDWTVQATCFEAGLCDDVDCDDGNECTVDTASIDEAGRTAHVGDLEAQVDRMLLNVAALLEGQGATFGDVVSAVTYLKRPSDAQHLREKLHEAGFEGFPNVLVAAPICRPELLCETEALVVLPREKQ
jgi:hypothetical protein